MFIFAVPMSRQCGKNPVLDSYALHFAEKKELRVPQFCQKNEDGVPERGVFMRAIFCIGGKKRARKNQMNQTR